MPNLLQEQDHLTQAEIAIANGVWLMDRIEALRVHAVQAGFDPVEAARSVQTVRDVVGALQNERTSIIRTIADIEQGKYGSW